MISFGSDDGVVESLRVIAWIIQHDRVKIPVACVKDIPYSETELFTDLLDTMEG